MVRNTERHGLSENGRMKIRDLCVLIQRWVLPPRGYVVDSMVGFL